MKKNILKHMIIKLLKISDKENIFKAGIGGGKRQINAHRNKVSMTAYFSSEQYKQEDSSNISKVL